jgi:hypothetical protein
VLHELQLCIGWSGNEHRSGVGDGFSNALQEILILCRVTAADTVGLVVKVARRIFGMDHEAINI